MSGHPKISTRKVDALIPYARNARTHSAEQIDQIAASIKEFGWTNPVLVDGENGIIAGHGRVLAARKLGQKDVPVIELAHLSEAQRRAYILADNKLALNAGWDDSLLAIELQDLASLDFDVSITGFSEDELDKLNQEEVSTGLTEEDAIPGFTATPATVLGDVWILGKHRVMCGDSTSADDVGALLAGVEPHLMVTDPPYGVEYDPTWRADAGINKNQGKMGGVQNDDRADWRDAWALFPGDVAYVWHADKFSPDVAESLRACDFELRSMVIWAKSRLVLSRGHYHYQHEPCWYAVKKGGTGHWSGDRSQTTLWQMNDREDSGHGHGTQKPVEAMRRPVVNNSSRGQTVYDPFLGSGTTLIACETTGRTCYGMEIDPRYCDVIVRRWQEHTGKKARHAVTGDTFDDVLARSTQSQKQVS